MKILLTGGTGFIGSAVLERLVAESHQVTAIVRSQRSSLKVQDAGATGIIGDLFDAHWLASELRGHDGAIHTAAGSDDKDPALNDAVLDAVIDAFGGTTKPFVHTGGIWTYGNNPAITEISALDAPPLSQWRTSGEQRLLDSAVKASVVQPAVVYGHGKGIPAMFAASVEGGAMPLFGGGHQHWTSVHVEDLADLYVRALDRAPGGRTYIGASGQNPTVRELGEALAVEVVPESPESTIDRLGGFGEALLLDQQASGDRARSELGWQPTRPSLIDQLKAGYSDAA
ncbi:NAD-dependent epimerase/dehydratase family protein [Aeromicrobium sp.]|uniref:NAD-dependent epimerase/dehydratase family protein n=1 Tax=Aeromicrobium sp. TaxID=1871063 RepID=UPI0030BF856F